MRYIVLDLEWNQAMSSKASIFNKLPIHLRGEIIQIGAVKLTEDLQPGEEFQADIKPIFFKRMHYKVKKLTGIDKERLSQGKTFPEAMEEFRRWCGDGCTFLTWGFDDRGIMEQNIMVHDLDWDWIDDWINLQYIYNLQTGGDRNQKALSTAMENFEIEQTRVAHDALGDAYNTALVCSKLDLKAGVAEYQNILEILAARTPKQPRPEMADGPAPLARDSFEDFTNRAAALADCAVTAVNCPDCGESMSPARWVSQGDKRYMSIYGCPEHGSFLIRLKFKKAGDESLWSVTRLIYKADEAMERYYRTKAAQPRRRSRRSSRSKKSAGRTQRLEQ